jgi:Activator of Hsp90 ATPase homolog 1-like protein
MTGQDYSASITANITPQEATERINRVADWWTTSFTGTAGKLGDAFTVRFGETFVSFAVVELVPARRIVWLVTDCNLHFIEDKKEWRDTRVVFDISSDGAATSVTMTHTGLVPGVECYEVCRKGWNFCITESLQKLLTENQGIPDGGGRRESAEKAGAEIEAAR